jgi:hypothetical protein
MTNVTTPNPVKLVKRFPLGTEYKIMRRHREFKGIILEYRNEFYLCAEFDPLTEERDSYIRRHDELQEVIKP